MYWLTTNPDVDKIWESWKSLFLDVLLQACPNTRKEGLKQTECALDHQ